MKVIIDGLAAIKRFLLFPLHWRLRGEVLPALSNANFHGIVQKKPIHNVKDEPLAKCQSVRLLPAQLVRRQTGCLHPGRKIIREESGGAYRDRTDDLMLAKQPLSQLS